MRLGKLTQVELREYWRHEARNFTTWLAEPENLAQLADEVGLDIRLVQTEAGVGRYAVDMLAEEETTGRKIVIENQLEATDHSHLGQILTYAAGIEAEFIIWVVREARDEHRQAIEWLNEHTDERINCFLVQIELWRIGESDPAPKFHVVSRPNDWTKSIRTSSTDRELSDTKTWQLDFWQGLREFAKTAATPVSLRAPRPQHWQDVALGRSDCHISLTVYRSDDQVGAELYIPNSKGLFRQFAAHKEEIERIVGLGSLSWEELPAKKASRIKVTHGVDLSQESQATAYSWLVQAIHKLRAAFSRDWPDNPTP